MKTSTYCLILVLTLFSYSCGKTSSDKPSSIEKIDKSSSIDKMFQLIDIEGQMGGGFEAMLPIIDQMSSQLQLDAEEKEQLKNIYRDWFENDIDRKAMKEEMAKMYAEAFTAEEINELNKFYSTPIGQKFLEKSPELMRLGAQIGMEAAQKQQGKLMERLQPLLGK